MSEYQVIARRFRPQSFSEVVGQEAIVTTLKNAVKFNRLAHSYLFCGSRGTGKTTLARLFAKVLNCASLSTEGEPCNRCSSCLEITSGSSMDVLEIDGASHRGIEDIRQINDNVGYAPASGRYKVYIIDEVHMLTKEAFNALLKTLEEPPEKVKFFFATTEPHKIPPTILSRCQRFNLNRIPLQKIVEKLATVSQKLSVEIDEEALRVIAQRAEGGLRDAESLLDQIIAFQDGKITLDAVNAILGLMPREIYFSLDRAGKEADFSQAFEVVHQLFSEGKDFMHFVDGLIEHFRTILLIKCDANNPNLTPLQTLSSSHQSQYMESVALYSKEQCLDLIDYLLEAQGKIRFASSPRIALEAVLLHVMRSHFRLPVEVIVKKLSELENSLSKSDAVSSIDNEGRCNEKPDRDKSCTEKLAAEHLAVKAPSHEKKFSVEQKIEKAAVLVPPEKKERIDIQVDRAHAERESVSEDPTPTPADLGIKPQVAKSSSISKTSRMEVQGKGSKTTTLPHIESKKTQSRYDTILQFASIELDGRVERV